MATCFGESPTSIDPRFPEFFLYNDLAVAITGKRNTSDNIVYEANAIDTVTVSAGKFCSRIITGFTTAHSFKFDLDKLERRYDNLFDDDQVDHCKNIEEHSKPGINAINLFLMSLFFFIFILSVNIKVMFNKSRWRLDSNLVSLVSETAANCATTIACNFIIVSVIASTKSFITLIANPSDDAILTFLKSLNKISVDPSPVEKKKSKKFLTHVEPIEGHHDNENLFEAVMTLQESVNIEFSYSGGLDEDGAFHGQGSIL